MAVFVYLSPEIGCFLGPVPVVTKLPKLPLRGHGIPPAGVGQHKRASLFSVEGTIAYLMDLMRIQLLPFESHRATPQMEAKYIKKQLIWSSPPVVTKLIWRASDSGNWIRLGNAVVYHLVAGTQPEVLYTPLEFCYIPPVVPSK